MTYNYTNKTIDLAKLRNDLAKWYAIKEKFWKDKSRDQNLALGDRNTKYFHTKAKQRFKRNRIDMIRNEDNIWLNTKKEISECITQHFQKIATTVKHNIDQNLINLIPTKVTQADNDMLCTMPLESEIKNILFFMEPDRSSGPDGFPQISFNRIGKSLVLT